jgi:membrane fusion protein, heavy metal efflux system
MIKLPAIVLLSSIFLVACGESGKIPTGEATEARAKAASGEYERGPHKGRMLRDGSFAVEVTIFETNEPPHYRLYLYKDDKPLPPDSAQVQITLKRLDGEVNEFSFKPEKDYLKGSGEVIEPHSFDVTVQAQNAGASHRWTFDSYEGRTTIAAAAADSAGVKLETAGPAVVHTVALDSSRHAQIRARFPGIVRAVNVQQGQRVRRGEALAIVEGNDSMRNYPVVAPFDGIVLARNTSVGDVAGAEPLIEMADLSKVWVELRAIGADAEKLAVGQRVAVASATGAGKAEGTIQALLPLATGQSVVARLSIDNPEGRWRPGMTVSADVTISSRQVPLTVKESGLQRFRDFTVVFARFGETYEVRMLELGERDGTVVEVLGGIKPGTPYVTEQSFLIKADVEKSGASHDH